MDWPEVTRKRFLSVIKDLLDNKLPDEVVIPKRTDIEMFMALWETWQSVSSTTVFESKILLKKVQKQRKELLFQTSCNSNPEDLAETKAVALKKLVEGLQVGSVDFENSVWETIHEEARSCFNKGSCRLQKFFRLFVSIQHCYTRQPSNGDQHYADHFLLMATYR
ncbi:hypothetical protein DAPPUDRAFT_342048 [Daphnia pulex]|uniref:Uncharacterized protein n=1 Tax=Daphnia pulex TaxID=6669 RepID=E9I5Q7_DAPPU|nr:hypothetical protein DAPPUDRAFT_342048 [Daphnia pulex]|eukprot:EFX60673.1 hypothetical protein DAPPUDRAFT_342048 [Daphnia pulex]